MTKAQQRWLVESINALADQVKDQPGFLEDADLRASYVVLHSAMAAAMFDELIPLAQTCADFCEAKALEVEESN